MPKSLMLFSVFLFIIFILSCNGSAISNEMDQSKAMRSDSAGVNLLPNLLLPESKFIRTASLKSKVKSVNEAVAVIEYKTRALGGYVGFSHFFTHIHDSSEVSVSRDSALQIMHFSNGGYLTLRVPDEMMDSLLAALRPLSTIMLDREIRMDDVSIQMLANQLTDQRSVSIHQRLSNDIKQKGKKLLEIEQAEKTMEEKQRVADEAKISNLNLEYAVQYSTISVEIYQDPEIRYTEIAKERKIVEFKPSFLYQMGESFSYGWQEVKDLIIDISRYWILVIPVMLGYGLFRHLEKAKKVKITKQI